jgi:hypothetical protein
LKPITARQCNPTRSAQTLLQIMSRQAPAFARPTATRPIVKIQGSRSVARALIG